MPALGEIKDLTDLDPALELSLAQVAPTLDDQLDESLDTEPEESLVNLQSEGDENTDSDEEMDNSLNNE